MKTLNNKLIIEPYEGIRKVEAKVTSGFATIKQRTNLIGLKVLLDGTITQGQNVIEVKEGQIVYYQENTLYSQAWAKEVYTCDDIKKPFILAEAAYVILIK